MLFIIYVPITVTYFIKVVLTIQYEYVVDPHITVLDSFITSPTRVHIQYSY